MAPRPRVLIVAGSDSGGGAGIQADLKTVSVLGAWGMTAVTALTAQNTTGVLGIVGTEPEFVARQIDACVLDLGCDAVKTGMLGSAAVVGTVAGRLRAHGLGPVVVDPVMVSKSGARLLAPDAVDALRRQLLPLATLVTPNLPEAEVLTGRPVTTLPEMRDAARAIRALGPRAVVVKGGHLAGAAVDVFFDGHDFRELGAERIAGPHTHGTGCIFASAAAARLAAGDSLFEAVSVAKRFVTDAVRGGLPLGRGHGPADPFVRVRRDPSDVSR